MSTKQVLVVRKDLNMRKGKIAAQCAHASMKVLLDKMVWRAPLTPNGELQGPASLTLDCDPHGPMWEWLTGKFTKICVYVNSEEELLSIHAKALALGLPCALIADSGATEFKGVETNTVVAVGPALSENVDQVTAGLPLL